MESAWHCGIFLVPNRKVATDSPCASRPNCYQIAQTIQYHLPHLRESQSLGLTLWVYGTIVMGSACQNAVSTALSFMGSFDTMRQYLRQWLYDGQPQAQTDSDTDRRGVVLRSAVEMGAVSVGSRTDWRWQ